MSMLQVTSWCHDGELLTFPIDGKNHCKTSLRLNDYEEIFFCCTNQYSFKVFNLSNLCQIGKK